MNDLTARELAVLEYALEETVSDTSEAPDTRHVASGLLGKVQGEVEFRKERRTRENGTPRPPLP